MTRDVVISISGAQFSEGDQEDVELITTGDYFLKNGKHFIIDASRFVCAGMLLQVADARLLGEESLARRWLHLPRNQAKQRSFARTVHADQADPIMLAYLKGDIVEQLFFAEADA